MTSLAKKGGATDLINDPAKNALGKRKQLAALSKLSKEEIEALSADELKKIFENAANLDENDKPKDKESSLRISIELDLEVEVHLSARVQGEVTIGLL